MDQINGDQAHQPQDPDPNRDLTAVSARVAWLRTHTDLADLSTPTLTAIAQAIQPLEFAANRRLILEDTRPDSAYILYAGQLESYRTSPIQTAAALGLLPGAVLHLREIILDQVTEQTVISLTDCLLWQLDRASLTALAQAQPELRQEIDQLIARQLASQVTQLSAQLSYERDRALALRPYLVPKVKRGIVGSSRYATRLRKEITQASRDRQPLIVFGEPGLEKDNIAALIHFGSQWRKQPLIKLNGDTLQPNGAELFGRAGGKVGLLEWLGTGTLMLNNAQDLPPELLAQIIDLLKTGQFTPVSRAGEAASPPVDCAARIIFTAEKALPQLESCLKGIKVPPLRVRKADIAAQTTYFLSLIARARGGTPPRLTPEALRRLQAYDFPGNLVELETLVERAVIQANGAPELTEALFWASSTKGKRFRWNLLNAYPRLRSFLVSPWWPNRINYGLTLIVFPVIVAVLMLGPQSRDRNFALNFFWAWWWPLILVGFPFVGRLWCSVCPFMIYGEALQWLSLKLWPRQLLPWPRQAADQVGGWFLLGLFTLILLWEELWNLENTAYLSGWLLLLITAGAVIFSQLFERRFWCRYLCPIGGMNGLFAKLSMIELRAQQGICSASCTTYQCYKGGPAKGEGQETGGCPIYSHPAQLQDNRDCVLCMTCLKACPHRSVELNLRPPGIELWTTHIPTAAEVGLLFLLFGAVWLHHLPQIVQFFATALNLDIPLTNFGWHSLTSAIALCVPGAIAVSAHQLLRRLSPGGSTTKFIVLAYGYLPLALGANLAHYLPLGLTEAGQIIPVSFATFGAGAVNLPMAIAHPAVISFLQGTTLCLTTLLSNLLTQKIARQPLTKLWPQHLAIGAIALLLWQILLP